MNDFAVHENSLVDLFAILGDSCPRISWSGQSIRAMPSNASSSSANSPGGFSLSADMRLVALVADFAGGVLPDSTQFVTYPDADDGDAYKIVSRSITAGGRLISLTLEHSAQGL
jgi:hypothetical protein